MTQERVPTPAAPGEFRHVATSDIRASKTNPRKVFDTTYLEELTQSVRDKGILQPILLRPVNGHLEIVAGECRFRAAKAAQLATMPAIVRELSDLEVLEIQLIENLRRADLHPLDEAEGYAELHRRGYDVSKIAARVGRSEKYIYDRIKLNALTPDAKELFRQAAFEAGHAILLARLKPEDQDRAMDSDGGRIRGLFVDELDLYQEDGKEQPRKAVSVREFQSWIAEHVKFDRQNVDPVLFPETAAALEEAKEDRLQPVPITFSYMAGYDVKADGKERIYGSQSWKRADGKDRSKTCERSRLGVVVEGIRRGDTLRVCVNRQNCDVHFSKEVKVRKQREAAAAKDEAHGKPAKKQPWEIEQEKRQAREKLEAIERQRFEKARPQILEAFASAVKKAPTKASGLLSEIILNELIDRNWGAPKNARALAGGIIPRGKTAEDLLRHAAFLVLLQEASHQYSGPDSCLRRGKAFGIDVKKIVDEVSPPAAAEVQTSGKKPKKGRKG